MNMKPKHKEFFKELKALVNKYRAEIGQPGAGLITVVLDRTRYKFGGVDALGAIYVTEHVEHVIERDEEPKP